jgi:FkbM family methyltransferase
MGKAFMLLKIYPACMVSFSALLNVLRTTSNFWVVPSLKWFDGKKEMVFRNGFRMELRWGEYRIVRDLCSKGYSVEPHVEMFRAKKGSTTIVGTLQDLKVLTEDFDAFRLIDFRGKTVLDVGGFIGDTAVLFSSLGAKKVVIYEPVASRQEIIETNLKLNSVNAELHEEGLGEADGYVTVRYETAGIDFGLTNSGTREMQIKVKAATRLIEESGADVAKFDCEGAEINLLKVPASTLRKVAFYIVEAHSPKIKHDLRCKFADSGFELMKEIPSLVSPQFSVLFFKRI